MSRISDNGLPRSVPTLADRPASAYNGYIVLVEETGVLYVYTGAGYATITTTSEDSGEDSGSETDSGTSGEDSGSEADSGTSGEDSGSEADVSGD